MRVKVVKVKTIVKTSVRVLADGCESEGDESDGESDTAAGAWKVVVMKAGKAKVVKSNDQS